MKRTFVLMIALIFIIPLCSFAEDPVYFADSILKDAVETILEKTDPTPTDMLDLKVLNIQDSSISSIVGLETALNLFFVCLDGNRIVDITPLSYSTKNLWFLSIQNNRISDVSALSDLKKLTTLYISENDITDISPLSELTL